MKRLVNIVVLGTLILLGQDAWAQYNGEKSFERSYKVSTNGELELNNKYGHIIVRSWESDSVYVKVRATADGKSPDVIKRSLVKVDVEFRKMGDVIMVETTFDQSTGFFGSLLSDVEDYSKNLFGGTKVSVDYEVWMPRKMDLHIENKYGNVFLSTLTGFVTVDLSHGDLKANGLEKEFNLTHSFGRSRIDQLYKGTFNLKGAEVKVDKAKLVNFESSSSEITLGIVEFAQFHSRNDKISIQQADEIIAEGVFTDISVDMVLTSAQLDFNYGDVYITRVQKGFKSIDILGKSTDISLIMDQASFISANITADPDRMHVPNSMLVLKKESTDSGNEATFSGKVGPTQNTQGELNVLAEGGELIISINELPLYTKKN
ncbi:MAG: hypothetical protein ACFHWX_21375 [Bacteroidota bacterium]